MKINTIIGARPQFIKAAAVSRSFHDYRPDVHETIIHTGQHYDTSMSDVFFDELSIPRPDHNLRIGGGTHGQNTGRMLEAIENILLADRPDWVLVYGDTDSTLAGALAASKLHIPVAHVEAGLRSFNRCMPEELNRIVTDHLSSLLFTPTATATRNLAAEGIHGDEVQQFGDVMYDVAMFYREKAQRPLSISQDNNFILSTIHRAENTDNPERLANIIGALNEVAAEITVVLPLHPRTRKLLSEGSYDTRNILMIDPVSYLQMIWLLEHCKMVVTDSGGLQKEAYFFGKPCITTRDETEWVELVEGGWNILSSHYPLEIKQAISSSLSFDRSNQCDRLYGNGDSGKRIAGHIL